MNLQISQVNFTLAHSTFHWIRLNSMIIIIRMFCIARLSEQADFLNVITPHAQRERGKVIGRGVHNYYPRAQASRVM